MQAAFDIAIVGSGFAGSILAMMARRLGRSVVLIEKGKHPRFVIGESSTPLANLLLEEISGEYDLPGLRPFTKFGTWQQAHPDIACGLKRGFTFHHHTAGQPFGSDAQHARQLLVAASPNDRIADTHWYRPDFDAFLVREAERLGVVLLEEAEPWGVDLEPKHPVIQGRHRGQRLEIHAQFIVDATGPRGFLHRALDLPELPARHLTPTQALYAHFSGVKRWESLGMNGGTPPYPPDDAAVHHVFEGGWIWMLRFNNGLTSAGLAATNRLAGELGLAEKEAAWNRLLERFPSVRELFREARATTPFIHTKPLSFLSGEVAGPNWALLPSAAGFVDPLLSTGFPLTLLGVQRLGRILARHWKKPGFAEELCAYSMQTTLELAATERLISALYAHLHDFEVFSALTLLYFAAASYTETARRLGRPELAGQTFLLGEHPLFGPRCRQCLETALRRPSGAQRELLLAKIHQAIDPVNIAGLGRVERQNWYPALAEDLFAASAKLQSSRGEIEAMLQRCGFPPTAETAPALASP